MWREKTPDLRQTLGQTGLLISLVCAFVLPPFFDGATILLHLFVMLSLACVLVIMLSLSRMIRLVIPIAVLEAGALTLLTLAASPMALAIFYVSSILFFGALVILFIYQLFSQARVDGNILLASVNIYFAMGVVFAMAFGLIDLAIPGSFQISITAQDMPVTQDSTTYMYFSLVTLSTLGYGDILPLSDQARTLSALEALTGQVYLTIAVARLVGLHVSRTGA